MKPTPLEGEGRKVDEDLKWSAILFGRNVIYKEQTDQLLGVIEKAEDKERMIGQFVADIMSTMISDMREKGTTPNRHTILEVFKTLIVDVVQLAATKGVIEVNDEKQAKRAVNAAFLHSNEAYAKAVKSRVKKQGVAGAPVSTPEQIAAEQQQEPQQAPATGQQPPAGLLSQAGAV